MKKWLCIVLTLLMAVSLFGCSAKAESGKEGAQPAVSEGLPVYYVKEADVGKVDVDLTPLSITMLYSQIYNMCSDPQQYIGKRVKTVGTFTYVQMYDMNGQPDPDAVYYICTVTDTTACCQSGLEFVLKGDPKYPEDYPKENSVITVVGEFQTYMEGTSMYCHLVDAQIVVK